MISKRILLIFVWVFVQLLVGGQEFVNSKKLDEELLFSDPKYQKLVPLLNKDVNTVHLFVDINRFKDQFIGFDAQSTVVLYANNKLFKKYSNIDKIRVPINELAQFTTSNFVLVTLYSPKTLKTTINTLCLLTSSHELIKSSKGMDFISRETFLISQSIILCFMLFFGLIMAIQRNISPFLFRYVYNPIFLFNEAKPDDLSNISRLDVTKILFLILDSLVIAFIIMLGLNPSFNGNFFNDSMFVVFIILAILILKYILNKILAYVFRLTSYSNVQFFQFSRHIMLLSLILMVFYLIFGSPFTLFSIALDRIIGLCILSVSVIYIVKVTFSLKKVINAGSLYFISYICVSELIPVILFLIYFFSRINKGFS